MTTFDKEEVLKEFDNLYWVDPEGGSHHPVCVYKQEDEVVRGFLSTALTQAYEAGRRDAAKEVKTGGWVGEFGDNFGKPPFPLLKTSTQKEDE